MAASNARIGVYICCLLVVVLLFAIPGSNHAVQPTCTLADLTTGSWTARRPGYSSASGFLRGSERTDMLECEGSDERAVAIANWEFVTEDQELCPRWTWDEEQVARKLLSMSEGLIVVGDSLGDQFINTFRSLLSVGVMVSGSAIQQGTLGNGKLVTLHKALSIIPTHPLALHLVASGEFSSARIARPIVHLLRSHHLISDPTIARLVPSSDENEPVTRVGYPYGSDPDWIAFVRGALLAYSQPAGGSLENTSPTVVVVSSGPHWHFNHFAHVAAEDADDAMLAGYGGMVDSVIGALPNDVNLRLIVRATNPVADTCSADASQRPSTSSTHEPNLIPPPIRYNYHLFPHFDELWRAAIEGYGRRHATRVEMLDDGPMMGKRLEAKKGPTKGDCLHFCIPALYETARILMEHVLST